jgi:SAM-dependent methyltransferase
MTSPQWFENWFNSPYYHLLYNHRNYNEAHAFIENLCKHLHLNEHARVWDLACGKGRHSLALHQQGLDVIGTDLAENSIAEAQKSAEPGLDFLVHDMREPFKQNYFDVVLNLFTSLGYFSDECDNEKVFKNVDLSLKQGGLFVIDFFNSNKVLQSFRHEYTEIRGDITFQIKKQVIDKRINKHIEFNCGIEDYFFEELVSLLNLEDFERFAENTNLRLESVYGNYHFDKFDQAGSERLIIIFRKGK